MACLREPCPPVKGCKKKETNTAPHRGWSFQEISAKLTAFSLYFLISSPSLCYKRNWHPNPVKMVFQRQPVCHLLRLPAFRIKSYSLPQHLVSDSLACRAASRAGLDLVTVIQYVAFYDWFLSFSMMISRFIHVVASISTSFLSVAK